MTIDLHDVRSIKVEPGRGPLADRIIIEHEGHKLELILHSRKHLIERSQIISIENEVTA